MRHILTIVEIDCNDETCGSCSEQHYTGWCDRFHAKTEDHKRCKACLDNDNLIAKSKNTGDDNECLLLDLVYDLLRNI